MILNRKVFGILLTVVFLLSLIAVPAFAQQDQVDVYEGKNLVKSVVFIIDREEYFVNGATPGIRMDAKPFIESDRTFVPVRYLGNALGVVDKNISWNQAKKEAGLSLGANKLSMIIGKKEITANGQAKAIDVAPILRSDRTYLPARYVAEGLGYQVDWDADNRLVICWPQGEDKPDVDQVKKFVKEYKVENSYTTPVVTDMKIRFPDANNTNNLDLNVLIRLYKPLDEQYQQAAGMITSKFGTKIADEVIAYVKQKTDWKQDLDFKDWKVNGYTIRASSKGGNDVVSVTVWRY